MGSGPALSVVGYRSGLSFPRFCEDSLGTRLDINHKQEMTTGSAEVQKQETGCGNISLHSFHNGVYLNMLVVFKLVDFSCELTRISIGDAIPR